MAEVKVDHKRALELARMAWPTMDGDTIEMQEHIVALVHENQSLRESFEQGKCDRCDHTMKLYDELRKENLRLQDSTLAKFNEQASRIAELEAENAKRNSDEGVTSDVYPELYAAREEIANLREQRDHWRKQATDYQEQMEILRR